MTTQQLQLGEVEVQVDGKPPVYPEAGHVVVGEQPAEGCDEDFYDPVCDYGAAGTHGASGTNFIAEVFANTCSWRKYRGLSPSVKTLDPFGTIPAGSGDGRALTVAFKCSDKVDYRLNPTAEAKARLSCAPSTNAARNAILGQSMNIFHDSNCYAAISQGDDVDEANPPANGPEYSIISTDHCHKFAHQDTGMLFNDKDAVGMRLIPILPAQQYTGTVELPAHRQGAFDLVVHRRCVIPTGGIDSVWEAIAAAAAAAGPLGIVPWVKESERDSPNTDFWNTYGVERIEFELVVIILLASFILSMCCFAVYLAYQDFVEREED